MTETRQEYFNFTKEPKARARISDPGTSHVAAASVQDIKAKQEIILNILKIYGPLSDSGIWGHMLHGSMSPSGARTRRSELVRAGRVRNSGKFAVTLSGRKTIIWEIA